MQFPFQPKRYNANMPPTPVTEEMRTQLVALAQRENVSLAQVQRTAFTVLLRLVQNNDEHRNIELDEQKGGDEELNKRIS